MDNIVIKSVAIINYSLIHMFYIDHFMVTGNIVASVVNNLIIYNSTNPSNHKCVILAVEFFGRNAPLSIPVLVQLENILMHNLLITLILWTICLSGCI